MLLSFATKFRLSNILYKKQNEFAEMCLHWEAKAIKTIVRGKIEIQGYFLVSAEERLLTKSIDHNTTRRYSTLCYLFC